MEEQTNLVLQRLMDKENINQRQLAERVGMKRERITSYINQYNKPTLLFWIKAQKVFHIPDSEMWAIVKASDKAATERYYGGTNET